MTSFKHNHFPETLCPNTVPFQGIRGKSSNMNLVGPNSAHNVVPNKLSSLKQQSFILCTNLIWAELSRDGSSLLQAGSCEET